MNKIKKNGISKTIVFYELITGMIELALGLSVLFFGRNISRIYAHYKLSELLEGPHEVLIGIVQKIIPILIHYHTYLMISMIVFGAVKIIGGIGLLYYKKWGLNLLVLFFFLMLPLNIYTLFSHLTFLKTMYFLINILITLYLIKFKPHVYFLKFTKYLKKIKK